MKNKKYVLTGDTKNFRGYVLHRIKAIKNFSDVKKGDLGGWVENESNLSQEDDCWLYDNSMAFNRAIVYGKKRLYGNSRTFGFGNITIYDDTPKVYGCAYIEPLEKNKQSNI